ncbi:hypothetical protein BGW37DRAFT_519791 [Umbelopsis sp. PMI_123]|nr:hypothetical protein BGW37DRAFT_519791 [Umbelopsis sp. PMI_123]
MNLKYLLSLALFGTAFGLPRPSHLTEGDVVGKVVVGYQGWFASKLDTSDPNDGWYHWGNGTAQGVTFEIWPDTREYSRTYQWDTNATLGNGDRAVLYDNYDQSTVDVHFKWMKEYGIDTAAFQRFGTNLSPANKAERMNGVLQNVRRSAEKYDQKFYVMWDISGWSNFTTELPADWLAQIKNVTVSSAYAKQDGKPVVCVWGMGVLNRPGTPQQVLDLINYLKNQGLYVIGGSRNQWATFDSSWLPTFAALDMIQPWNVGSYFNITQAAQNAEVMKNDTIWCKANNVAYQPVIFPGAANSNSVPTSPRNNIPREHGDFLWQQFVNIRQLNITNVYVAMFDEYDEGTAIAKAAEDSSMIPTNHYFLTLDADGTHLSSDFYLRVTNDGGKMMKGETPLVEKCPTKFT